ncbi:MAG: lysophospholipid acyltransferase family protein [Desulfovibrio sp.]|jgi:lysophospholipid acyltransferase (LPLAT)-like uncharacterized protein|nr:lysophospholipid acyltransferase family protein [Desulfovibrio sp.]
MKIPPWFVAPLIHVLYRLWCATLRITEVGRESLDGLTDRGQPVVLCLWHDELFPLMHVRRGLRIVTLVSRSRDGEYLARLLQALGLLTVRGSSSRGGISALIQAVRLMREKKYNVCLTIDGPRGPRHVAKDGAIFLALHASAPIVPIRLFMEKAKRFHSWDRFQLPMPFSRIQIVFGQPYSINATKLESQELKKERDKLQHCLENLHSF